MRVLAAAYPRRPISVTLLRMWNPISALSRALRRAFVNHEHTALTHEYVEGTELPDGYVYEEGRCACGQLVTQHMVLRRPGMRVSGMR